MQFVKKIFGYQADPSLKFEFTNFRSEANLYQMEGEKRLPKFVPCLCKFLNSIEKNCEYVLHIKNLEPKSPEEAKEYYFPIHEKMNLKTYFESKDKYDVIGFLWDLDEKNVMCLEYTSEKSGLVEALIFKEALCKLIYQTIYKQSYHNAKDQNEINLLCKEINQNIPNEPKTPDFFLLSKNLPILAEEKGVLLCNAGGFFSIDANEQMSPINTSIAFILRDLLNFNYNIEIYNAKKQLIYKKQVNSELSFHVDTEKNLIKWLDFHENELKLLSVRFEAFDVSINLKFLMTRCAFEANRKEYFVDIVKKDEVEFANKFMTQESMEIEESVQKDYNEEIVFQEEFSFCKDDYKEEKNQENEENKTFVQAKVIDRSFVSKGCQLSVYKTDNEKGEKLEYITNLPILKSLKDTKLNPKKIVMHELDSKILMLDGQDSKAVYYMDIEKGKIVSELQPDDYNSIKDIVSETKLSSLTNAMTFLGINDKNIFKIDPRVNPKQAAVETKTYATNNGFTHISTNAQGNFAIGNDLGEVRLFTKIGQKAKNNYPGLGDPIIGIDSSKDGKWVLATCKNYIMLIPTFYENQNGFTHSIKNINKATPRILRIHPKDLKKLNIKDVCFGKAVFDDSEKNKEEFIVVSTGDFLFIWNLKQILQGKIFDYEIQKVGDNIINNEFKYNQPEKLFVTMNKELRLQKLKRK